MQVILPLRDALAGAGFFVLLGGRMTLQGLLALLTQRPEYKRLTDQLRNANALPALTGITEAARPFVVAALASGFKQPVLLVVNDEAQAKQVVETLKAFLPNSADVFCLPDRDALPYERLISDSLTTQQRMQALIAMVEGDRKPLVVCSARVLTQLVIPPQEMSATLFNVQPGQEVDLTLMLQHLYNL